MEAPPGTLLLDRDEVRRLLGEEDYLRIVEDAFRAHADGRSLESGLLHVDAAVGEFHIKAGGLEAGRPFFGLKANGGFFGNRERNGMPNIQGLILLCDAENGYPLALMDSTEITINRTGATTAVAARYLARSDSRRVTIIGCGTQGRVQLAYLARVCPVEEVYAYDHAADVAAAFVAEMTERLGVRVHEVADVGGAVRRSDICITCTPSIRPFLGRRDVPPGMFLAAVGADSPEKRELATDVLADTTVVVDLLAQCRAVGELHHALRAGVITDDGVHAELADVVAGRRPGRTSDREVIVFDATGTALQDTAAAAAAYTRAVADDRGRYFDFFRVA